MNWMLTARISIIPVFFLIFISAQYSETQLGAFFGSPSDAFQDSSGLGGALYRILLTPEGLIGVGALAILAFIAGYCLGKETVSTWGDALASGSLCAILGNLPFCWHYIELIFAHSSFDGKTMIFLPVIWSAAGLLLIFILSELLFVGVIMSGIGFWAARKTCKKFHQ